MVLEQLDSSCKEKKHQTLSYTFLNKLKWIIELSVKHRTLKLPGVPWLPASQHVDPSSSQSASASLLSALAFCP